MENLKFFAVCAAALAAMLLIAAAAEKYICHDKKKLGSTHYVTYSAVFAAMAGVLMTLEIPLFFAPTFYKLDFSELPVLICTFYLGPVAGVATEFIKILVKLLLKGTSTAFVGDLANFLTGCAFILPASIIYHAKPGKKTAIIGMAAGTLILAVFGSLFNAVYLIPKFAEMYGMPLEAIVSMGSEVNGAINSVITLVLFAVVPFNLVKGIVVSLITYLLYKRISPLLHKGDEKRQKHRAAKNSI